MSTLGTEYSFGLELDPKTAFALSRFARRRKWLLIARAIAAGAIFFIAAMLVIAVLDYALILSDPARWLLSAIAYGMSFTAMWWFGIRRLGSGDPQLLARQLESAHPKLREHLLSAVELADPGSSNGSESFRGRLQRQVGRRAGLLDIDRLLPLDLIQRWLMTALVILTVCCGLLLIPRMQFGRRIARAMLPGIPIQRASLTDLQILQPSPPTGFVAEGDAVAVTVQVTGASVDDVWLQWRSEQGVDGESPMTPRVASTTSHSNGTLGHQGVYSANLSVGTDPVRYRVIAGDAITLWNELTPLPRPRVASFEKRYEFPAYAELADRVEQAEHGDLKALVGTLAKVMLRFDEPVQSATLRFGNRGVSFELDPVNDSDTDFSVTIPIRTPANYQIDARSVRSGLNNPFSPQYTVTPIIDSPPVVRWDSTLPRTMIVSPLDVLSLSVSAVDDLPMDRIVHEFQINNDTVIRRKIPVSQPSRELDLPWQWDLLHRMDDQEESIRLASGDILRMRVVGIDRNSQRGESTFIELLVAEEGFDSDRHRRLQQLRGLSESITDWVNRSRQLMNDRKTAIEASQWDELDRGSESAVALAKEHEPIAAELLRIVQGSRSQAESATWELIGRSLLHHQQRRDEWFATARFVRSNDQASWEKSRSRAVRELINDSKALTQEASRIDQYLRAAIGEELTAAVIGDAMALGRSLRPLTDLEKPLPEDRFPRYLAVAVGRMQEIGRLVEQHESVLPESTIRHLENWQRMSSTWESRFSASIKLPPEIEAHRSLVKQFAAELRNQYEHSLVDGRIPATLVQTLRDLDFQMGGIGDRVFAIDRLGAEADKSSTRASDQTDSNLVAGLNRDAELAAAKFQRERDRLLERLAAEEALHRSRPDVDLQYAADLKLFARAIENVTSEGYAPYRSEPAALIHQKLARAFQMIEATHDADGWLGELRALLLAERRLDESVVAKIHHPTWIERFPAGMDWPVNTLKNFGVDHSIINPINQTRYNDSFNRARSRITQRRYSGDEMLSAEAPLDTLQQTLGEALRPLEDQVIEARETIRQYVLTLPEQARQAAQKARESQQQTAAREDAQSETVEQLDQQQKQAEEAARATIESLVDVANTIDLKDAEQRELARDADAAAAQVQAATDRAEQSMKKAQQEGDIQKRNQSLDQAAESMQELAEALERTAEHFERAENGEDVAETREQLRQAEDAMQMQQEMQERYDRAAALAEAAQSSPEELMERLERELAGSEPMQQELSEISERAAEAAQRTLQQAAKDEKALHQSLERSDPAFQEQKRRAARQVSSLARRISKVNESLLQATDRAIGWANAPELKPDLQESRQKLQDATDQASRMGGDQALLSDIQKTAAGMAEAILAANESIAKVNQQSKQAESDNLHNDDASRQRARSQLQRFASDARAQRLRASINEKQDWANAKKEAGNRVQQAQRQMRDARNQKAQIEQRIRKDPKQAANLQDQLERIELRSQLAKNTEKAAETTIDLAELMQKQAEQRGNALKKQALPELNTPNPAAELAKQMTDHATEELTEIRDSLKELANDSGFSDQLRLPADQAPNLASQQSRIENDVNDASEQLRRAARHEQRLGQSDMAERLDAVADAVHEQAANAAATAREALKQAGQDDDRSPRASESIAEATSQIEQVAQQLAQLIAETTATRPNAEAVAQPPSPAQQRGQQLARTLDELDRAMAQTPQGEQDASQQSGQPTGEQQQPSANETANQQAGQPQNGGQPSDAEDASPTLSNELNAQAQQAARQRGQQLNPSAQGQQPGSQSSSSPSNSNAATQPGSGNMPNGGFVDTMGVDRLGSDWGQLRERRTEDATETRSSTIAPQYRREIEAYFRALAKRAAESTE